MELFFIIIIIDNKLKRKLTNDSSEKSENEIISKKIHIDKPKTTIEPEPQKEIITKIENLFPFLQDIMGQNDARSNTIINRLIGLRENLDQIF